MTRTNTRVQHEPVRGPTEDECKQLGYVQHEPVRGPTEDECKQLGYVQHEPVRGPTEDECKQHERGATDEEDNPQPPDMIMWLPCCKCKAKYSPDVQVLRPDGTCSYFLCWDCKHDHT